MNNKEPQSEIMFQVETLPQSMVKTKTIVLKPRLDQDDIELIGEKLKPRLFSKFGFKRWSEDVQLLCSELYFEPYFIIGGKYVLDYCKKHVFNVNVNEKTNSVFVAGEEFKSEQLDPKTKKKLIKMSGEEYVHHERQAYFILDRMKREIAPEKLPLAPFDVLKKRSNQSSAFKTIDISDETQIEFLRTKIAQRPSDMAEIIKEVFDITERTIAYYPMFQLTFQNLKNQKDAAVTLNGITGEIILNGTKKLAFKTIITFPRTNAIQPNQIPYRKPQRKLASDLNGTEEPDDFENVPNERETVQLTSSEIKETMALGFPAKISGEVFIVSDDVSAVVGDIEVPSGSVINKTLVVKGILKIGDNCGVRGKLKALKDITIGSDTIIDGDLISGGDVFIGSRSLVTGSVEASGKIEVCEHSTIEQGLRSDFETELSSDIQLEADCRNNCV